jgi:cellulose synthase/poly-beta-1,6-N-acetylglucosamine synthase-like glycosyltransferase
MFALEYGLWFKWLLKGLEKLKLPIPLGGTSCHFKTDILKEVCYWDPYNVTEDAELGLRLSYCGYKTEILEAETMEESPIYLNQWIQQRTRWIKGYIQTYIINFHLALFLLFTQKNYRYFLTVQLFIGLPSILFIIKPFLFICNFTLILFPSIISQAPFLFALMTLNFICGLSIPIASSLILMIIKKWPKKISCLAFPFYWMLHSFSALKAIKEIFNAPFHWNKTPHGLSKLSPHRKFPDKKS